MLALQPSIKSQRCIEDHENTLQNGHSYRAIKRMFEHQNKLPNADKIYLYDDLASIFTSQ